MVSITPEFSSVIDAEMKRLDGRTEAHDWDYAGSVVAAYKRWPTVTSMCKASLYAETAGMKFRHEMPPAPQGAH
jgi:hypothetical protein